MEFLLKSHVSKVGVNQLCVKQGVDEQWNYSEEWDMWKKCTVYKYLPYTVQCKSVDVAVNQCCDNLTVL